VPFGGSLTLSDGAVANPALLVTALNALWSGLASSTRASYATGASSYFNFCSANGLTALPASEDNFILFAAFMADTASVSSIRQYLCGLRSWHIDRGLQDPVLGCSRLQRVLKGLRRKALARHA
jgi:hypothetical protein